MAQIDDLNAQIATLSTSVTKIQGDITAVIAELKAAQANGPVDLSGPIATLTTINTNLAAADASLVAVEPASTTATTSTAAKA